MKPFKFIVIIFALFFGYSCSNHVTEKSKQKPDLSGTDFIYLSGNYFELKNERFFPIMLNYCVSFRNIDGEGSFAIHQL
jgi:hypothetical protein